MDTAIDDCDIHALEKAIQLCVNMQNKSVVLINIRKELRYRSAKFTPN